MKADLHIACAPIQKEGCFALWPAVADAAAAAADAPCPACSLRYGWAHDCPAPAQPREAEPEYGVFEDYRQSVVDGMQWLSATRDAAREAVGGFLRDWAVTRW